MGNKLKAGLLVFLALVLVAAGLLWWHFLAGHTDVLSNGNDEPVLALAQHLDIPWALDFLPDGSIIFTERPGRIRTIDAAGALKEEPL